MIRRGFSDRSSSLLSMQRVVDARSWRICAEHLHHLHASYMHPEHHHTTHHIPQPSIMHCHTIILTPAASSFQVCIPTIAISHKPQSYSHMFYIIINTISRFWRCGAGQTSGSQLGSHRLRVLSITKTRTGVREGVTCTVVTRC
jgi:hypothetical protein